MKRCTWDCSSLHVSGSTLFFLRPPEDFSGDFPSRTDRLCTRAYCTHTGHPRRVELPPCCHDASVGALVEWGAPCSRTPQQEAMF